MPLVPRLALVGLGLGPSGMPMRGLELALRADAVFLESYTALPPEPPERLASLLGRPVEPLGRADVEDGRRLLEAARRGLCVLLVPGDPLSATTHVSLRRQAAAAHVTCEVVPAASILTAAPGAAGLSHYKFGRTTTLVLPRPGFAPESPFDALAANLRVGLHTLVLLDLSDDPALGGAPTAPRCMTATEGLRWLLDVAARRAAPEFGPDTPTVVVARAGAPDQDVVAGTAGQLAALDFGPPMHTLLVPGRLSDEERDALAACARAV